MAPRTYFLFSALVLLMAILNVSGALNGSVAHAIAMLICSAGAGAIATLGFVVYLDQKESC